MHKSCIEILIIRVGFDFFPIKQQVVIKLSVVSFRQRPSSLFRELVYTIFSQIRYIAR